MITTIIFDIGGVILDSERTLEPAIDAFGEALGIPKGKSKELYDKRTPQLIVGKMSAREYFAELKEKFGAKGDLKKIWLDVGVNHINVNQPLIETTDRLREKYRTVVLSNVTELRGLVDQEIELYDHFDDVFLSYKIKMKKPEKKIYQHTLKKLKASGEQVLFIDDKEANLKTAREFGIRCIQFNNNKQLFKEFARIGLV